MTGYVVPLGDRNWSVLAAAHVWHHRLGGKRGDLAAAEHHLDELALDGLGESHLKSL